MCDAKNEKQLVKETLELFNSLGLDWDRNGLEVWLDSNDGEELIELGINAGELRYITAKTSGDLPKDILLAIVDFYNVRECHQ